MSEVGPLPATRLYVIQPYVPRYRSAFYQRSATLLSEVGVELVVVVGRRDSDRGDGDPDFPSVHLPDLFERATHGRLRWRNLARLVPAHNDLLLIEQAIKNLDGYAPLLRQHFDGPSVGFWGHGRSYSSRQGRVASAWKQVITRRSQWFFAYTPGGAKTVVDHGFPACRVSVLNNTLDDNSLRDDIRSVSDSDVVQWAASQRFDPKHSALFIGGIDARKDIQFVLEFAQFAREIDPAFVLLLAGGGEDLESVQKAQNQGAPVRVLGRVDGRKKALALRAARVLTIPSQLGLVVVDSLVAGIPIATKEYGWHGPEAEYLSPGDDSLWLDSEANPAEYALEVVSLMRDEERLSKMKDACRMKARQYTLGSMCDNFVEGVTSWKELARYGL